MALATTPSLQLKHPLGLFQTRSNPFISLPLRGRSMKYKSIPLAGIAILFPQVFLAKIVHGFLLDLFLKSLVVEARANTRTESPKVRNRRLQKKLNGSSVRPRLSVFCSAKQLYAMLVDDQNKKCLFYGSTLQKSIRGDPSCTTIEPAQKVGEELIKACVELRINEISSYDRNGFHREDKMKAFEIPISQHGFLPQ